MTAELGADSTNKTMSYLPFLKAVFLIKHLFMSKILSFHKLLLENLSHFLILINDSIKKNNTNSYLM